MCVASGKRYTSTSSRQFCTLTLDVSLEWARGNAIMIQLSRESIYYDKYRCYEIIIDGMLYGNIGDGETKEIDVVEGSHSIYLKIDWCRSNELIFIESKDKFIEFECGNSVKGLKKILTLLYISFFKNKYLYIKYKDSIS